jgi:flagellar protein FliS
MYYLDKRNIVNNSSSATVKIQGQSKKFLKNVVDSASPVQLIVLLYEGCLQWLHMAKQEIKKNKETKIPNWSNYSNYMGMALEILTHLQDSLDEKQAKEFSDRMFALYDFMKSNITKSNANKDEKLIDEVVSILKDIKDTWKVAIRKQVV